MGRNSGVRYMLIQSQKPDLTISAVKDEAMLKKGALPRNILDQ
jgi:hypothetical protein